MNCLNINRFSHHLQVSFKDLVIICHHWYRLYAPAKFSNRRNLKQAKISDSLLLALLIWQAKSGIESQRRFWEVFDCLSHSLFNRRSRQLLQLICLIRQKMNRKVDLSGQFLIIDSFPVTVCQPIRNYRARKSWKPKASARLSSSAQGWYWAV